MAQYIRIKTELCKYGNEFWPTKRRGTSWIAERFAVYQHGPWSMDFVCYEDNSLRHR